MRRLTIKLVFAPEYQGYVAEVRELPGCMSQGKTIKRVLKNVGEAIELFLA